MSMGFHCVALDLSQFIGFCRKSDEHNIQQTWIYEEELYNADIECHY